VAALSRARASRVIAALVFVVLLVPTLLGAEENVAFNVESRKFHCLSCRHAIACTKNCIEIALSEAKRRGGVPCKVCRGSCSRSPSEASQLAGPKIDETAILSVGGDSFDINLSPSLCASNVVLEGKRLGDQAEGKWRVLECEYRSQSPC
jgi:hypothetical protein